MAHYGDACIVLKGRVTLKVCFNNRTEKKLEFKNNGPFMSFMSCKYE